MFFSNCKKYQVKLICRNYIEYEIRIADFSYDIVFLACFRPVNHMNKFWY